MHWPKLNGKMADGSDGNFKKKLSRGNAPILHHIGAIAFLMVTPRNWICVVDCYKNLQFWPNLFSMHFSLISFIDNHTRNAFSFSASSSTLHHGTNMVRPIEKSYRQKLGIGLSLNLIGRNIQLLSLYALTWFSNYETYCTI